MIVFEQPLNEHIRICLRLEHLFKKAEHYIQGDTVWASRMAMTAILEALNVVDRPDLKNKLVKAMTRHALTLSQLEESPQVDKPKLQQLINTIDRLIDCLHGTTGKVAHALRENEFLTSIRHHLQHPGGACAYSTPSYYLWLQKTSEERQKDMHTWLSEFTQLGEMVELLLQLTRNNTEPMSVIAEQGFYQQSLDANTPYQLVRVTIPTSSNVYPEISVGKHRMSVHFMELKAQDNGHPNQSRADVEFQLSCCKA